MRIRLALLVALSLVAVAMIPTPTAAQPPASVSIPTNSEWVGPLTFHNGDEVLVTGTRATLTFQARSVRGTFVAVRPGTVSGEVVGTIDEKNRFHVTVRVFGNARVTDSIGRETLELERCHAEGTLTGVVTRGGVLRWAAKELKSDTALNRLKEKACANLTNVLWMLQPRE